VIRKLLLADDSVTIQRVVELTFSGEDIRVTTVSDGEQAIARIEAESPDIVLADIAMPKKTGYDVAAFVKEHATLSHVPVLLLAGAFEPVDDERAKRVKADGVLVKPFETHEVIARVRELLDRERPPRRSAPVAEAAPPAPAASPEPTPPPVAAAAPASAPTPAASAPAPPASAGADESLDDYFDRLDLAFASRAKEPPRPFPHLSPPQSASFSESATASAPAARSADTAGTPRNVLADLFQLFFEVEQGERDPSSIRIPDEIERIRRGHTIE
jgi:CheY-like chemotaxis protein